MKKAPTKRLPVEMKSEYDFSSGVRGKYTAQYRRGTNIVLLDPKLAAVFPDSKLVNEALHALVAIAERTETSKRP